MVISILLKVNYLINTTPTSMGSAPITLLFIAFLPVLRIRIRDPGFGIQCLFDPGPDPGSRIPTPYFLELSDKFLGKKLYNSLKTGPNFFL
jgi:hypothetical protein